MTEKQCARTTVLTPQQFAEMVSGFRDHCDDPAVRRTLAPLYGGEDVLSALLDPRGVGIGRFATLMDVPATTLRHFLREGLLHPYEVGGKFRFFLPNVIELRGVQQWQALGLTLEETRDFLEAQWVAGLLVTRQGDALVTLATSSGQGRPAPDKLRDLQATALALIREANARLAAKHAALTRQLEQARALEDAVAALKIGGPDLPPA